jgi:hypothetical protein
MEIKRKSSMHTMHTKWRKDLFGKIVPKLTIYFDGKRFEVPSCFTQFNFQDNLIVFTFLCDLE